MANQRILIVEDEKIIALDLQRRLEKYGFEIVDLAATADTAVESAMANLPDIILMDIMLGGERDGIDAAIEINGRVSIPIVFLTAYADERTVERAKAAEPVGYVLKPFKERELHTTIDIALYKARVDRTLKEQERLFAALLNNINDALVAVDENHTVRFLNPVAQNLTGMDEELAIGRKLAEVFQLVDEHTELDVSIPLDSIEGGKGIDFDNVFIINKQNARISVSGSVTPIMADHGLEGSLIAFQDVTDIRQMSQIIEYQASHDSLTGLMNREEFFNRLQEIAQKTQSEKSIHSFLYVDLDQFHVINDVCGHLAGDELLRQVAHDVETIIDRPHSSGRLGGDEFGYLLEETPLAWGIQLANDIRANLSRKFIWQKNSFNVSASIGVVPVAGVNSEGYSVLAAADDACFLAKEAGGNAVKVYETTDYTFLKRHGEMQWISRLTRALEEDRFVLFGQRIQPVVDTGEERYEILIRLRDEDDSFISPGDFIPAAEKYNLMPAIDRWVISHSLSILRSYVESGRDRTVFSINLSAASIADESMLGYLRNLIDASGVEPNRICLELTETTAIANKSRAGSFMAQVKTSGITFALDDFGNGFSSFSYLKHLPVDYLKIDGSFVRDMTDDPIDAALVGAVNEIGHVMGLKTIAEFVKDSKTMERLRELGVDYLQGYQIAKPGPMKLP